MSAPPDRPSPRRGLLLARALLTLAALGWVATMVDGRAIAVATAQISPLALLLACALTAANLVVGASRWRVLLQAYGAPAVPPFRTLVRLYFMGFFYNTWLPGGLGGDAVRGVASREAFGARGVTGALAVVVVERVLGVVALLVLIAATSALFPFPGADPIRVLTASALGVGLGALGIASIALGARAAPSLPGPVGRVAARLPRIERPGPFAAGVALSLASQGVGALAGHAVVQSLAPAVPLAASLVVIPLALATSYLPFLVNGTGARELAFVALYGSIGVAPAQAVAASLLVFATQLTVGLFGAFLRAR